MNIALLINIELVKLFEKATKVFAVIRRDF
jgi:hypothetical protein